MTDLAPTREHTELAAAVRSLLERRSDGQAVRQGDGGAGQVRRRPVGDAVRADRASQPSPSREERRRSRFSLVETSVVLEELGRRSLRRRCSHRSSRAPRCLTRSLSRRRDLSPSPESLPAPSPLSRGPVSPAPPTLLSGSRWSDGALPGTVSPVLHGDAAEICSSSPSTTGTRALQRRPSVSGLTRTARERGMDPTLSFARLELDAVAAEPISLDAASMS